MPTSLQNFTRIAAITALFVSGTSATASAQTEYFESYAPAASGYVTNDVEALYEANSQRPLGGLFARGFTRTFTLLGGGNFTAADLPGDFSGAGLTALTPDQDISDVGYVISVAMGRRHNRRLRSEFEFAIRGNEQELSFPGIIPIDIESEVSAYSLMKNVFLDAPNRTRFTPYVGAGLGISLVEVESQSADDAIFINPIPGTLPPPIPEVDVSEEDATLSYQFIGGVATRVNHAMDFVVEYRIFGTSDVELDTLGSARYIVNNLFLGVKLEY